MDGYGGHLQLGPQRPLVQRFDIGELVNVLKIAGVELALGEGVKHERVIRIGAVGDTYDPGHLPALSASFLNSSTTG
jgi:hypothetical protein